MQDKRSLNYKMPRP